jgi:hypothetical protein
MCSYRNRRWKPNTYDYLMLIILLLTAIFIAKELYEKGNDPGAVESVPADY